MFTEGEEEEEEEDEEDRRGCGVVELDGGGVGKVKEVCCSRGVEEEEEESVGVEERTGG